MPSQILIDDGSIVAPLLGCAPGIGSTATEPESRLPNFGNTLRPGTIGGTGIAPDLPEPFEGEALGVTDGEAGTVKLTGAVSELPALSTTRTLLFAVPVNPGTGTKMILPFTTAHEPTPGSTYSCTHVDPSQIAMEPEANEAPSLGLAPSSGSTEPEGLPGGTVPSCGNTITPESLPLLGEEDGAAAGLVCVDDGVALGVTDGALGDADGMTLGLALGETLGDAEGEALGLLAGDELGAGEALGAAMACHCA